MYEVNKDFYPNDSGWLGYGNVSKFLCVCPSVIGLL